MLDSNGVLTHYIVSVIQSKIKVSKETSRTKGIIKPERLNDWIAEKYLTEQAAIDAIKAVLPHARAKFETCQAELKALETRLGFYNGYTYDGDTHGIYNEYSYISFKLEGFNFEFELER